MQTADFYQLPDFSAYGYHVTEELGRNRVGGRTTYKATDTRTNAPVVIKEFRFGGDSSWTGYRAYEREVQVLRTLDHPGIPHFLDAFETPQGWGLVQEYKQGMSLAAYGRKSLEETKHLAEEILKILVYLQSLNPPVIHRDIKLENILMDTTQKVTLVDFGFAKTGGNALGASSVIVGTYGLIPPEQLLNRELGCASDLYSLGATLLCLLAGINSWDLANFVDESFAIDTKKVLPVGIDSNFRWWLEKMVAPKIQNRFPTAKAALEALQAGQIEPSPETTPRLRRTRKIAKTTVIVSLAASAVISTVAGIGFGIYEVVQWGEQHQQKNAYQIPNNLPIAKPKPHVAKQVPSTNNIETQLDQILNALPYIAFYMGIISAIFGVVDGKVRGRGIFDQENLSVLAPGVMMITMAFSFKIIKTLVFDTPDSISLHSNRVLIEKNSSDSLNTHKFQ